MPFAMTHLCVAHNLLETGIGVRDAGAFLLGALAPDAVHYRAGYDSDMKKKSHLCVGDEKWGRTTDNDGWRAHVLDFAAKKHEGADGDFLLGYCCHILSDIENNIRIWMPFVKENRDAPDRSGTSVYHQESAVMDYSLYRSEPRREEMWALLSGARSRDVRDLVTADEIERMKRDILDRLYQGRETADVSRLSIVTLPVMQNFITDVSAFVGKMLLDLPAGSGAPFVLPENVL